MAEDHKAIGQEIKESGKAIFSYESQGETWWAGVTSYPLGKRRQLWIGILVPNDDLLEGITQLRLHILVATLVTLLAALAYSFLLARSYSRPLEALAAQSRRIRDLDFQADEKIEAKLREFKQLEEAQAQSLAALQSFSRYVPLEIVKELMAKGEVARIGGHTGDPDHPLHRHCRLHQHLGSHVSGGLDQSPGRVLPGHDRRPAPPRGHGGQDRRRRHCRLLGGADADAGPDGPGP